METKKITYKEYAEFKDDIRREVIDGVIYLMPPAPTPYHQVVIGNLYLIIGNHLKGHKCKVYLAPFDIRLDYDKEDSTILQPDLFILCDKTKIENGKHCLGAPDVVFEVLSPSTSKKDLTKKLDKYIEHGVKEMVYVDPKKKIIVHYTVEKDVETGDDAVNMTVYSHEQSTESTVFTIKTVNLDIPVLEIFDF